MSCLEALVQGYTASGQAALQKALGNWLIAGSVRSYLPQTWVVTTEQETLVIHAAQDGALRVSQGPAMVRDGAIAIRHDVLAESIRLGKPPPSSAYQVAFYTDKGRAAFEHLAGYFGL